MRDWLRRVFWRRDQSEEIALRVADGTGLDDVWFTVASVRSAFGIDIEDLMPALAEGRIRARGKPVAGGYDDVHVNGDDLARWMADRDLQAMRRMVRN